MPQDIVTLDDAIAAIGRLQNVVDRLGDKLDRLGDERVTQIDRDIVVLKDRRPRNSNQRVDAGVPASAGASQRLQPRITSVLVRGRVVERVVNPR